MNLKSAYEPYFKIGAAISRWNLHTPANMKLLTAQFSSFTCENDMKPMYYLDKEANKKDPEKYNLSPALTFENAVPYLKFAKENGDIPIPFISALRTTINVNESDKSIFKLTMNLNI